jgi:hypothetical protein
MKSLRIFAEAKYVVHPLKHPTSYLNKSWASHAPNTVALLDTITSLAARLVHVNCDEYLALVPDDACESAALGAADATVPRARRKRGSLGSR